MLKEVKDAVDNRNDDGIILFLGILKGYPDSWRPMLNEVEKAELFSYLETASSQSSLQAQFKLAVIPRRETNAIPIPTGGNKNRESWYAVRKQEKLKEYKDEIARLEPIANKGYAPAALFLYGNYAHNLTKSEVDQESAMLWLKKAAELGNAQAAYLLGLNYLNVADQMYGCTSSGKGMQPNNCQLPKDEIKGWHWIQEAAKHANEPSLMISPLDELSLNMGDLYMRSVAGNKPEYEQAYLWYRRVSDSTLVWAKLEVLKSLAQLKLLNPLLDKAWGNSTTWQEAVQSQEVRDAFEKSADKLPKLIQQKTISDKPQPIFSMATTRWFRPNLSYMGILLDVYEDGRVNLLFGDATFNESNDELLMRVDPRQISKFIDEFQKLNFIGNYRPGYCESGCLESIESWIIFKGKLIALKDTSYDGASGISNPDLRKVLGVVEKYFPLMTMTCDADIGEGKRACYQIYKEILPADSIHTSR